MAVGPVRCSAGTYCERGANASMPCRDGWLVPSAEVRCPAGATSDPVGLADLLFILACATCLLVIALELFALVFQWRARRMAKQFGLEAGVAMDILTG